MQLPIVKSPRFWGELVGQPSAVKLMRNIIEQDNFPFAILVTGHTGIGKTSLVNLFVKAALCLNRQPGESEPCGTCEICKLDPRNTVRENNISWIQLGQEESINQQVKGVIEDINTIPYGLGGEDNWRKIIVFDEVQALPTNLLYNILFYPEIRDIMGRNRVTLVFISMNYEAIERKSQELAQALLDRCVHIQLRQPTTNDLINFITTHQPDLDIEAKYLISRKARGSYRAALQLLDTCRLLSGSEDVHLADVVNTLQVAAWDIRRCLWRLIFNPNYSNFKQLQSFWQEITKYTSEVDLLTTMLEDLDYLVRYGYLPYSDTYQKACEIVLLYITNPLRVNGWSVVKTLFSLKLAGDIPDNLYGDVELDLSSKLIEALDNTDG